MIIGQRGKNLSVVPSNKSTTLPLFSTATRQIWITCLSWTKEGGGAPTDTQLIAGFALHVTASVWHKPHRSTIFWHWTKVYRIASLLCMHLGQTWLMALPCRSVAVPDKRFLEVIHRPQCKRTSEPTAQLIFINAKSFLENVVTLFLQWTSIKCLFELPQTAMPVVKTGLPRFDWL